MADDVLGLVTEAAPRTLADLRRIARTRELGPGEFLVRQGDALELYVVLEGWLAARRTSAGGRTYTMAILHDGAVGGVQSAWRDGPSMFDIVALSSARVATLKGSRVRSIAKRDPALAYRLFVLAASATIGIGERMDGAVFDIARKRLVRVLLRYEPIISGPSPILSRSDLAGLIETSREMLGIAIRALEADGLIRRDGRRIAIVNRPALEREAELTETAAGQESWVAVVAAHWPDDLAV